MKQGWAAGRTSFYHKAGRAEEIADLKNPAIHMGPLLLEDTVELLILTMVDCYGEVIALRRLKELLHHFTHVMYSLISSKPIEQPEYFIL